MTQFIQKTVLAIALVLTVGSAFGQNFKLGLQTSPQLSWLNTQNKALNTYRVLPGLKYGLEADFFLGGQPRYAFNTGFFVSNIQLHNRLRPSTPLTVGDSIFTEETKLRTTLNYVEIPLNLKMRTDQFHRITFSGQFGLSPSIRVSAVGTTADGQLSETDLKKDFSLFNVGLLMGAGAEYDLGRNTALKVGIQYSKGLVDATRFGQLDDNSTLNSLRLLVGVMF